MDEPDVLALVHRRAHAIGVQRAVRRVVPALLLVVALATSVAVRNDDRPESLRVVGEGNAAEQHGDAPPGQHDERADGRTAGDGGEGGSGRLGAGLTPGPVDDEQGEVRAPNRLPAVAHDGPSLPRPRLLTDPEGDDTPDNDAVDLRYGTIAYDAAAQVLHFTIGVTDLDVVPPGVGYGFSFRYDDVPYGLYADRFEGRAPVVKFRDHECRSCSLVYDGGADEVRIAIPLQVVNDRIAADSGSANWPVGRRPSPPLGEGSTFDWFRLNAYVLRGGPLDGSDVTQPHDLAEVRQEWSLRDAG